MSAARALRIACLVAVAGVGCGARSYLSADDAKYPVSMSPVVRGPDGTLLSGDALQLRGKLNIEYKACRMLWTIIPLWNGSYDLSEEVNEQVAKIGGEAIVNLTVESGATIWSVMTLVGVLPDCSSVHVNGDIVSRAAR